MKNRALVIALGAEESDGLVDNEPHPMLQKIVQRFKQHGVVGEVACVWLRLRPDEIGVDEQLSGNDQTGTQTTDRVTSYDMTLDKTQLSRLYYETDMRSWCGPNWEEWGEEIVSNRLVGKLVMNEYLERLYHFLIEQANTLSDNDSAQTRLNFYLIAPLHEPFASGAVFDVAYLLHRLALERGGKAYGLLLLPGIKDDPVTKGDNATDNPVRRAICYAALRELHFYAGEQSFFNHSYRSDNAQEYADQLPFQSGDCYLIGGDQLPLEYQQVSEDCAWWVYLQTCTDMADALQRSDMNRSVFSTFGVASEDVRTSVDDTLMARIALQVTQTLLAANDDDAPTVSFIQTHMTPRFVDESYAVENELTTNVESFELNPVRAVDARHQIDIEQVRHYEGRLAERAARQQGLIVMEDEVTRLTKLPGLNLLNLEYHVLSNHRQLKDAYRSSERMRGQTEAEATAAAGDLRENRAIYQYTQSFGMALTVLLITTGFTLPLVLVILVVIGQVQWVIIALALVLPIGLVWGYEQRVQRRGRSGFENAQRQITNRLYQMVTQRAISAYLHQLDVAFSTIQVDNLVKQTRALQQSLPKKMVVPNPRYDVSSVIPQVLERAWVSRSDLTPEHIRKFVDESVREQQVVEQRTSAAQRLTAALKKLKSQSAPMLKLKEGQIPPQDRESVISVAGVRTQNPDLLRELAAADSDIKWAALDTPEKPASLEKLPALVVVTLRRNIPLRTISGIDDWSNVYHERCFVHKHDESYKYRALLHPTRLGIAVSDLDSMAHPHLPALAMMVVILLRLAEYEAGIEYLCRYTGVKYEGMDRTHYDELCGALNDEIINALLHRSENLQPPGHQSIAYLLARLQERDRKARPQVYEGYADWEVWAEWRLREAIKLERIHGNMGASEILMNLADFLRWLEAMKRRDDRL